MIQISRAMFNKILVGIVSIRSKLNSVLNQTMPVERGTVVSKLYMRDNNVVNLEVGDEKVVLFYDSSLDTVRAFSHTQNSQNFTFTYSNGDIIDEETSSIWSTEGTSNQESLFVVDSFDVMWFAWVAFYPQTGLLCFVCS